MTQMTAKISGETSTALRLLAMVCKELSRPLIREEWEEVLETQHIKQGAQKITELLEHGLAEEWRGAYRVSRQGIALLEPDGLERIDAHDRWILGDHEHHGALYGPSVRQVSRLDDLLPLGYGDILVPVSDERFALVDARPGDILVFRYAHDPKPGDVCTIHDSTFAVIGVTHVTVPAQAESVYVLVAHIRRFA